MTDQFNQQSTWQDHQFADPPKGHPSTWAQEVEQLRIAITHALARLDASLFTNAEHQQAKDTLRAALQQEAKP